MHLEDVSTEVLPVRWPRKSIIRDLVPQMSEDVAQAWHEPRLLDTEVEKAEKPKP
jgi:hypothetical protein